jgi:hypothetical protein
MQLISVDDFAADGLGTMSATAPQSVPQVVPMAPVGVQVA